MVVAVHVIYTALWRRVGYTRVSGSCCCTWWSSVVECCLGVDVRPWVVRSIMTLTAMVSRSTACEGFVWSPVARSSGRPPARDGYDVCLDESSWLVTWQLGAILVSLWDGIQFKPFQSMSLIHWILTHAY